MAQIKKIAWISTAVIPYSETKTEFANAATHDRLRRTVEGLDEIGVTSTLLLPRESDSRWPHILFGGSLQVTLAEQGKAESTGTATGEVLQGMVDWAWNHQNEFDLIVNIGHDYLPIYMVGKFRTPFITLPNLCQTIPQIDELIRQRAQQFPQHVCFFSKAQRNILGHTVNPLLSHPFDVSEFPDASSFRQAASQGLGWAGRITPEKGLDRALEIAKILEKPLWAAGPIHDHAYFQKLGHAFPGTFNYLGCLDRKQLYATLAQTDVFLQMQSIGWQEAFGRSTAEALLAGCPVLYHDSGANTELAEATDGGVMIAREPGQEKQAYEKAMHLNRVSIQAKARELFDHTTVAKKFLAYAETLSSS